MRGFYLAAERVPLCREEDDEDEEDADVGVADVEEDGVDAAEEDVSAVTTTLDDGEFTWRRKRSSKINLFY